MATRKILKYASHSTFLSDCYNQEFCFTTDYNFLKSRDKSLHFIFVI